MMEESVRFEREGHIGLITLNRPDELNALNYETLERLGNLIEQVRLDAKEIRVVIVKAEGRAFSAGADLKERRTLTEQQVRRNVRKIRDVFTALERLPQPTIAMINGFAFGGGFELALACDFRYAVAEAKMGLTEVSLGIIPGAGGTQRLSRLIGPSKAKELILTARRIQAQEAYQIGFVNAVAKDTEELCELAMGLANEILANAPLAVYQAKSAIDRGSSVDLQTGLDIETMCYEVIIPTTDRLEALEAFREKRKPVFKGE
ncbi:enoyl-CoA hydratase-related protein [Brevibacillus formosus]|uniref:Enoyl-CoA hydratase n=2 Tax=Brevibacillus formosus TaxID=54913 RepID=A0ABQ0T5P2_9BACL|nr:MULTISPECIES: enoyl-CoA hydratase-related protein [Brevibacillus]MED1947848.1 enoyl-CoA hydratase-related protein [Brevibacillus formosus]MED1955410.1 enoyl-CoA hydratase-related protein [Brevibacillus formosus]MED2001525.1 enoyl-CoA hydratase-related protein [Brevibacillus formosus]MED2085095.1 enoyl-CoA hydratase-related protein [Brevibacillus formosus]GED58656.1 enoyl-CoA hydratase [Brevibacillus formosus]